VAECENAERGLQEAELASLTGFTSRASRMLAHLRECWLVADESNGRAIEIAISELFRGQSFQRNKGMFVYVLTYGLEPEQINAITRGIR
jgi:hypothetical protein